MFSVLALAVYQKFDTWLAATLYQSFEKCQLPYIKASIVGRDLYQSFDIWTRAIEIYYISRMPREPLGALGSPWEPLGALGSPWEPLGALGSPWEPLGALGSPRESIQFQNIF